MKHLIKHFTIMLLISTTSASLNGMNHEITIINKNDDRTSCLSLRYTYMEKLPYSQKSTEVGMTHVMNVPQKLKCLIAKRIKYNYPTTPLIDRDLFYSLKDQAPAVREYSSLIISDPRATNKSVTLDLSDKATIIMKRKKDNEITITQNGEYAATLYYE